MSKYFIIIAIILAAGCKEASEFNTVAGSVKKKLIIFGEGKTNIENAQVLDLDYSVSAKNKGEEIIKENGVFLSDFHSSMFGSEHLYQDIKDLKTGDSIVYSLSYKEIKDQLLDEFINNEIYLSDSAQVRLQVRVNLSLTTEEYIAIREKQVKEGVAEELEVINEYLESKELTEKVVRKGDLHYLKIKEMGSKPLELGMDIGVAYSCYYLNGELFDEISSDNPLYLNLGTPDQVITGIESVLKEMNEGEVCRVFIPSYLAFGENGSTDGRVPPKTPIFVDVEVVEILE